MKWQSWIVCALLALAVNVRAEDKVSADIEGTVEVEGINFDGSIVGDAVPGYTQHAVSGKVSVVTKDGGVHRIETFTEWSAENGVRGQVWEKLYVSGGIYTGWSERLIQTPAHIIFSRTVIDGTIDQKIRPDGSGYAEWTVAGADNGVDESSDNSDDAGDVTDPASSSNSGDDLPTVEILEEGEFDGVSDRRIEISSGDHPALSFSDRGYTRADLTDLGVDHQFTINQRLELDGKGKGSVAYIPEEKHEASPSPTPTPAPLPSPTPSTTTNGVIGNTSGTGDSNFPF